MTTSMLRFDPFRDFDRFASQVLSGQRTAMPMPMDVYRDGDNYLVVLDCPGMDPESLELTAENNTLTVNAARPSSGGDTTNYLIAERPSGTYSRQIILGEGLDLDGIDAVYRDGVLRITIPVAAQAKPRRINIDRTSSDTRVLAGESSPRDNDRRLTGAGV